MSTEHVSDLLAGYALGCLDEAELLQVAGHLPDCAICRQELAAYREAVGDLSSIISLCDPPQNLREKILCQITPAQPASHIKPAPEGQAALEVQAAPEIETGLQNGTKPAQPVRFKCMDFFKGLYARALK